MLPTLADNMAMMARSPASNGAKWRMTSAGPKVFAMKVACICG